MNTNTQQQEYSPNLIGFSEKIGDPVFKGKQKSLFRKKLLTGLIVTVIIILAVQIVPFVMEGFPRQAALIVGFIVLIIGLTITLISAAKRAGAKTWDGEVVDKKIKKVESFDGEMTHTSYNHIIEFKLENGRREKITRKLLTEAPDSWDMMTYLNVGDKVRYHGKLDYFEKHDKSRDAEVPCAGCGKFADIRLDNCPACGAPIIKPYGVHCL